MEKPNKTEIHGIKLAAAMASIAAVAKLIDETDNIETLDPLPRSMVHLVALALTIMDVSEQHRETVLGGCIDGLPFMIEALERKLHKGKLQ